MYVSPLCLCNLVLPSLSLTSPASRGLLLPKEELPQVVTTPRGPVAVSWQRDATVGNPPWNEADFKEQRCFFLINPTNKCDILLPFTLNM